MTVAATVGRPHGVVDAERPEQFAACEGESIRAGGLSQSAPWISGWLGMAWANAFDSHGDLIWSGVGGRETRKSFELPTILLNADFPFTVNRDGNIYSALWKPGRLEINRQSPEGRVSTMQVKAATNAAIGGVTGMASGPDSSLFVTDGIMLPKVTMPGRVSTLVDKVVVRDCVDDLPNPHLRGVLAGPFLRGLAVDSEGAVCAAANRCRAVLKIKPDGKVTTPLRATAPWSPTGWANSCRTRFSGNFCRSPIQSTLRRFLKALSPGTIRQIVRRHDRLRLQSFAVPSAPGSLLLNLSMASSRERAWGTIPDS